MTNKVNESFSAFLDGEASELDIQRLLKSMDDNSESFSKWHEISRVQAVLQGEVLVDTALDFSGNSKGHESSKKPKNIFMRLAQGGIAAAVATVFVAAVSFMPQDEKSLPIAQVEVQNSVSQDILVARQFEAQQRLDSYLREHAEQASFTTGHVVAPSDLEWLDEAAAK